MAVAHFLNTSPWVWPTCFIGNQLLTNLALSFTAPESPIRRITTLITVLSAYQFSHTISNFAPNQTDFRATMMCFTWVFLLSNNDLLNLTKASYEKHVAWKNSLVKSEPKENGSKEKGKDNVGTEPIEGTVWKRLKWSTALCWNFRRIGTQYQISNISPFSTKDPSYVPTRSAFLLRAAFLLVLSDSLLKFSRWGADPSDRMLYLITEPFVRFFPRLFAVSFVETLFRIKQVALYWVICGAGQACCYHLFAFICVALHIQDPSQWPPYFGSLSETWSIRQFWGASWHQTMRQFLTANGDYFVDSILRFPRGLVSRYTRLTLSFAISGVIHLAMLYEHGLTKDEAGSIDFFVIQALGIMLEDLVQAAALKFFPRMDRRTKRWIGYIWIMVFLLETTPIWYYSRVLHAKTKKGSIVTYPNFESGEGGFVASSVFEDMGLPANFSIFGRR